jgi:hypothetical protein
MAGILANETRKQKAIWMNLLFCRISNTDDYMESSSDSEED